MIGWLDCTAGVSGDMLLGALVDAGAPLAALQAAVDAVGVDPVRLRAEHVERAGLAALRVHVEVADDPESRTWAQVRGLLEAADLPGPVRDTALAVFARLAAAEGAVHRVPPESVHFHEVGALDAVADVVGAAAGVHALRIEALTASPVALGSGWVRAAHGRLPVPVPAVLALLAGAPVSAGPVAHESTTPTGAALLATLVGAWGPLPPVLLRGTGTGAGGRDPQALPNVLRLVLGEPLPAAHPASAPPGADPVVLLETNVDDLDPRVWPGVLDELLQEGALDAWLTPVLMKKGRPAHTLSVLCPPRLAPALRTVVLTRTSTLGVREQQVARTTLGRRWDVVDVLGQPVRVKSGELDGRVVHRSPEWEDVAAAAAALGLPAQDVLARATAASVAAAPDRRGPAPRGEAGPRTCGRD